MPAAKKKKATTRKSKASPKKASKSRPGVIAAIVETLKSGSAKKPLTKADVVEVLVKKFPNRKPLALKRTVGCQLPSRLRSEKDLDVKENERGYWLNK